MTIFLFLFGLLGRFKVPSPASAAVETVSAAGVSARVPGGRAACPALPPGVPKVVLEAVALRAFGPEPA